MTAVFEHSEKELIGGVTVPCKSPLKGWPVGTTPNNKTKYLITSYDVKCVDIYNKGLNGSEIVPRAEDAFEPQSHNVRRIKDYIEIPCGRCLECRLAYSRQWADRCMLEATGHKENWFLTLTYDEEHVPKNEYETSDGVIEMSLSLYKKDLQNFWKRLRDKLDYKIKYFSCGEYGETTFRPHYHAIVFGLHIPDLEVHSKNFDGDILYTSEWLRSIWKNGNIIVGQCTYNTCAYTARYILKKQYGSSADFYEKYNLVPEFTCMSLKPAIGREYFEKNKDHLFNTEYVSISTPQGGKNIYPPRYYVKLYDSIDEQFISARKERNKEFMKEAAAQRQSRTSKSYLDMLADEEAALINRTKALRRKEI